jgi:hypothetical protein
MWDVTGCSLSDICDVELLPSMLVCRVWNALSDGLTSDDFVHFTSWSGHDEVGRDVELLSRAGLRIITAAMTHHEM